MSKRHTETKTYIKEALTHLLNEKSFEDLTISDITRKAGINRSTFYLHYKDKYDMMAQLKQDNLDSLYHILTQDNIEKDTHTTLVDTFTYIKNDFDFFQVIAKTAYVNFSKSIKDFAYDVILSFPQAQDIIINHYGVPYHYGLQVYLASIESLISYWVATGGKESPEEMTDIISKVLKIDESISHNNQQTQK
ncbi:TetR/AcrR family transcriptional regulator [Streptococcus pluranimalium]|uniref:TetR/AcrR family transcriptional regulator n=1 Tax=Streptococcus hyovaginalis TaxID=149015 RepID=UPI003AD5A453